MESLRNSLPNTREVMSDVFIFENSQEYECYVLVIIDEENEDKSNLYEYFTLDVFSFIDVDLKELPMPAFVKEDPIEIKGEWRAAQPKVR